MKQIQFDHTFECDTDTFWNSVFFNPEFNRALFYDHLGFTEWTCNVKQDDENVRTQTIVVRPPVGDIPAAVKRALGDNFGYQEHGTFDRKTARYKVQVESNVAKDKTNIQGEVWLEKIDDSRCRRLARFTIEVKIMMIGKVIEDIIAKDMSQSFEKGAMFTNEWLAKKQ